MSECYICGAPAVAEHIAPAIDRDTGYQDSIAFCGKHDPNQPPAPPADAPEAENDPEARLRAKAKDLRENGILASEILSLADAIDALLALLQTTRQERDEARKDALYHDDCRPNRKQAEAAIAENATLRRQVYEAEQKTAMAHAEWATEHELVAALRADKDRLEQELKRAILNAALLIEATAAANEGQS